VSGSSTSRRESDVVTHNDFESDHVGCVGGDLAVSLAWGGEAGMGEHGPAAWSASMGRFLRLRPAKSHRL
jgi:hypothetical protein